MQTQKLASLGQLTAGIAHEIKNPLNFVNNFSGVSSELIDELQDSLKGLTIDQRKRAEINELTDAFQAVLAFAPIGNRHSEYGNDLFSSRVASVGLVLSWTSLSVVSRQ